MHTECNIYRTIDLIGKRWCMPVLLQIYNGEGSTQRFSEIKEGIGDLSSKVLTERVRELENFDLIERTVDETMVPNKVEYHITKKGTELIGLFQEFRRWASRWEFNNQNCEHFHENVKSEVDRKLSTHF